MRKTRRFLGLALIVGMLPFLMAGHASAVNTCVPVGVAAVVCVEGGAGNGALVQAFTGQAAAQAAVDYGDLRIYGANVILGSEQLFAVMQCNTSTDTFVIILYSSRVGFTNYLTSIAC